MPTYLFWWWWWWWGGELTATFFTLFSSSENTVSRKNEQKVEGMIFVYIRHGQVCSI